MIITSINDYQIPKCPFESCNNEFLQEGTFLALVNQDVRRKLRKLMMDRRMIGNKEFKFCAK